MNDGGGAKGLFDPGVAPLPLGKRMGGDGNGGNGGNGSARKAMLVEPIRQPKGPVEGARGFEGRRRAEVG